MALKLRTGGHTGFISFDLQLLKFPLFLSSFLPFFLWIKNLFDFIPVVAIYHLLPPLSTAANIFQATLKRVNFVIHSCLNFSKGDLIINLSSWILRSSFSCSVTRRGIALLKPSISWEKKQLLISLKADYSWFLEVTVVSCNSQVDSVETWCSKLLLSVVTLAVLFKLLLDSQQFTRPTSKWTQALANRWPCDRTLKIGKAR